METRTDEIAPDIFRFATFVPEIAAPAGFTFNQFLVRADEPLLFHCGPRHTFDSVSKAVARVVPLEKLRWISFGHHEADESGAMNQWLAACPRAVVAVGAIGVQVSINDLADRKPQVHRDGEVLELGGKRVRRLDTPHVPHGWDAGVLFEESTRTLLCGDLFTHVGNGPALVKEDLTERALSAEDLFLASCITPDTAPTMRKLAELAPKTLAVMHGSSFEGDGAASLRNLAKGYEQRLQAKLRTSSIV